MIVAVTEAADLSKMSRWRAALHQFMVANQS